MRGAKTIAMKPATRFGGKRSAAALIALLLLLVPASADRSPREGRELIGRPAPEFVGLRWLTGPPLTMKALRGKVVLVRFWLHGCPLCTATAPALEGLHRRFGRRGLQVIGIHHPKSRASREARYVQEGARKLGVTFPIAVDNDWRTIRRWWLTAERTYTSATMLVDRQGTIRWIHDGGAFYPSNDPSEAEQNAAYRSLVHEIEKRLADPSG